MRVIAAFVCLAVLAGSACTARADLASIHTQALPQETTVLAALDDARALEPYTRSFAPNWGFPVSKKEVVSRLGKDLGFLRTATEAHPENIELLLLTGLVAHYAYNVDVDGSYESAMKAFGTAEKVDATDLRPEWFRAGLQCQTMKPAEGMKVFLDIEASHSWEALPVAFWDDYMECATVTGMPAHVLRASAYAERLGANASQIRTFYKEIAQKRFEAFESGKNYGAREVWTANDLGTQVDFISTTCGVRLRVPGDWTATKIDYQNGTCVALFNTGPYQATVHKLRPSLLLMVQRAKEGGPLQQWSEKFLRDKKFELDGSLRCPVSSCFSVKADQSGMYGRDGNGAGRLVAFQREEPEYPGLLLEGPWEMPRQEGKEGTQFYRPSQIHKRVPGKLNYLVLLDVASSIEEPAMKDYNKFLEGLAVE